VKVKKPPEGNSRRGWRETIVPSTDINMGLHTAPHKGLGEDIKRREMIIAAADWRSFVRLATKGQKKRATGSLQGPLKCEGQK
jgi:hypothetical protein